MSGSNTSGKYDHFLARVSTGGVVRWAHALRRLDTPTYDVFPLAVTPTGEVCVASQYAGNPDAYDAVDFPLGGKSPDGYLLVVGR